MAALANIEFSGLAAGMFGWKQSYDLMGVPIFHIKQAKQVLAETEMDVTLSCEDKFNH